MAKSDADSVVAIFDRAAAADVVELLDHGISREQIELTGRAANAGGATVTVRGSSQRHEVQEILTRNGGRQWDDEEHDYPYAETEHSQLNDSTANKSANKVPTDELEDDSDTI